MTAGGTIATTGTEGVARGRVRMGNPSSLEIAARNKRNYLKAKAAFNAKDIEACILHYSPDHQIKSRPSERGRREIQRFFEGLHESWSDLQVIVEHAERAIDDLRKKFGSAAVIRGIVYDGPERTEQE